jgi:UDP:flavonoid glycosyltransferase YjiC (YdhE family)
VCIQVPFFGDQPFWGDSVLAAGVGPRPVPIGRLTTKDLLAAFAAFDTPEVRASAERVAAQMALENGRSAAVEHFHRHDIAFSLHAVSYVQEVSDQFLLLFTQRFSKVHFLI